MAMYYTVCSFTGIFYAVVRHISMLFIVNTDSVFCSHVWHPTFTLNGIKKEVLDKILLFCRITLHSQSPSFWPPNGDA